MLNKNIEVAGRVVTFITPLSDRPCRRAGNSLPELVIASLEHYERRNPTNAVGDGGNLVVTVSTRDDSQTYSLMRRQREGNKIPDIQFLEVHTLPYFLVWLEKIQ